MPPIIGITCKESTEVTDYTSAIEQSGGEPRLLVSLRDSIPADLPEINGLLLPGGGDVEPCRYNEFRYHVKGISKIKGVSKSRDALELQL